MNFILAENAAVNEDVVRNTNARSPFPLNARVINWGVSACKLLITVVAMS